MRIGLLSCACLVWLAAPVSAEDFSGFYAGVNAGYALQTADGHKRGFGTGGLGGADASAADGSLPPSARDASRALQSRNRSSQGVGAAPR
ncbi:hypothetical protein [Methylobacterium sp. J-068]|uniref:hypothetical protein n=1 Tax=Methylobacterium sp. J-068 TaxID=2836649 RepID=UPI001FB9E1E7|nr:hypothetical protein [Methylobacterium sp. J-068]MCJ2037198.1 hypothetical protein [Methylobacterium sp. J-068]